MTSVVNIEVGADLIGRDDNASIRNKRCDRPVIENAKAEDQLLLFVWICLVKPVDIPPKSIERYRQHFCRDRSGGRHNNLTFIVAMLWR